MFPCADSEIGSGYSSLMTLRPLTHQAAGHDGILELEDGSLVFKATTPQEISFYRQSVNLPLSDHMPVFMGTLVEQDGADEHNVLSSEPHSRELLVLNNITNGFSYPSVLDIKLGAQLTDTSTTTPEKIARLDAVSKSTTSGPLGVRICGMRVYNGSGELPCDIFPGMIQTILKVPDYLEFNKDFGKTLDSHNLAEAIDCFFSHYLFRFGNHGRAIYSRILKTTLQRLQLFYNALMDVETRAFSLSLLFVFENDISRWEQAGVSPSEVNDDLYHLCDPLFPPVCFDDEDDEPCSLTGMAYIDFAHSKFVPGKGHDENVLAGVESLMLILERLTADAEN